MSKIMAVVFDMGGVVVKLGSLPDILAGSGLSDDEIWERWILSDAVRRFEGGQCDIDAFAADLIAEFGVTLEAAELIERFTRFPEGLYPGAAELVAAVNAQATTGVLSNTNELHWTQQKDHVQISSMFDRTYLSYDLGLVKPDAAIYEHVADDLAVARDRILFIDDNKVNVDGAVAVGMQGAVAKGPDEAAAALRSFGLDLGSYGDATS